MSSVQHDAHPLFGGATRVLFLLAVAIAVLVLVLAALVPIYGDESASVMMRGMFFVNAKRLNTLLPQCGDTFLFPVPWSLYPGAVVSGVVYHVLEPWVLRMIGIVTWALCLWAIWRWMCAWLTSPWARRIGFVFVVSVGTMGVQGLIIPMVRAEQIVILMAAAYCCAPALSSSLTRPRHALAVAIGFMAATSFLFYLHPKALFFFPLAVASACLTFGRRHRVLCWITAAFVIACTAQSLLFFTSMTRCPGAPLLADYLARQTVAPSLLLTSPIDFVNAVWANLSVTSAQIWRHGLFQNAYQSAWLADMPGLTDRPFVQLTNAAIDGAARIVFVMACALPAIALVRWLIARARDPRGWLLLSLWAAFLGQASLFRLWNFYTGVPMMFLAAALVVMSVSLWPWRECAKYVAGICACAAFGVLLASAVVLANPVAPRMLDVALHADPTLRAQPFSVPTFRYAAARTDIRRVAAQCGISPTGGQRMLVDPIALGAFTELREPLEPDYIFTPGFGIDLQGEGRLERLLRAQRATRFAGRCQFVPKSLEPWVRRDGEICCFDLDHPIASGTR